MTWYARMRKWIDAAPNAAERERRLDVMMRGLDDSLNLLDHAAERGDPEKVRTILHRRFGYPSVKRAPA